jgi:hypothetical protein
VIAVLEPSTVSSWWFPLAYVGGAFVVIILLSLIFNPDRRRKG